MIREGHGFVVRSAYDSPWAGWFTLSALPWLNGKRTHPSLFLRGLGELTSVLPGGVSILCDDREILEPAGGECLSVPEISALHLPRVSLHTKTPLNLDPMDTPPNAWLHSTEPPQGGMSDLWRRGLVGWVPQSVGGWSLPGFGHATPDREDCVGGLLWGEVVIPAPALQHLDADGLKYAMEDAQAHIERAMSKRTGAGAWPQCLPFRRRSAAWRVALTGGWEYRVSGLSWEKLASNISSLRADLSNRLKCHVHLGVSSDARVAGLLGEQAMRLAPPWRNSLKLPPAPPAFTPGIGADPRVPSPLETRAMLPSPLAAALSSPPVATLRVPAVPSVEGVAALLRGLAPMPAIRWLPPGIPPPGPFHPEIGWEPASAFPPAPDADTVQDRLFEWEE